MDPQPDDTQPIPLIAPELLVATCDAKGERLHCNAAWTAVFGDDDLWGPLPAEDVRFANEYLTDARKGSLVTHQVFLVDRPGRDVPSPVLLHFLPIRIPSADPGSFPVAITGEVLQEPVTWAADQTRRRRMEMLGQMTMGIAHDFNNLLTTILGHVELLQNTLAADVRQTEASAQLKTLGKAAEDGASLVRKIQQYIRHEKHEYFEDIALHHLVDEVLTLTRPYWYN
ncbi:MAG: histidine kinase dimerization/phospho-acceptor domain-containing protein, partial [Rubricoccaceae bacterium]|nr:histidine kinase dimerization/phospho-acceptor domain-containing protein [Rubricoccaceae bacterium]